MSISKIISKMGGVAEVQTVEVTEPHEYKEKEQVVALAYPLNIGAESGHSNFFMFRAYDMASTTKQHYTDMRSSFTSQQKNVERSVISQELMATIALYAPSVVESVQHEFDSTSSTVLSDFLADAVAVAGADSVSDGIQKGVKAAKTGAGALVGQAQRSYIQNNAAQQLEKNSSIVTDNATVSAYKGTAQRQQTLTYVFHPKSLDELKTVGSIIKTFYSLSLPVKGKIQDGLVNRDSLTADFQKGLDKYATLLKTPPVWFIEEVSDSNAERYTPRFIFGPAGITSVKLNRTPDQYWRTFRGTAGDPSGIELELTFTELIPLDRAMYNRDMGSSIKGYQDNTYTAAGDSIDTSSLFDRFSNALSV
ncbi:baseplate tail-tube junction protein [Vibrio sp. 10N.286.49.E11]|uniref:baseplate tail-tube junction protein n=1 Tax=Vibrio sp. 10N.286.49.E11 TaxID=3229703 RepID=UPI00354C4425